MRGIVLFWDKEKNEGLIRGNDEIKYNFTLSQWLTPSKTPKAGSEVDFEPNYQLAEEIYLLEQGSECDIKDIASTAAKRTTETVKSFIAKVLPRFLVIIGLGLVITFVYFSIESYSARMAHEQQELARQENLKLAQAKQSEADQYFEKKEYQKAIEIYQTVNNPKLNNIKIAEAYSELGQFKECIETIDGTSDYIGYDRDYRNILVYKQLNNSSLYILRGSCYAATGNSKQASMDAMAACNKGDCSLKKQLIKIGVYEPYAI